MEKVAEKLNQHASGLTVEELQSLLPQLSIVEITEAINDLSSANRISLHQVPSVADPSKMLLFCQLIEIQEANMISLLNQNEKIVYTHIKAAGNRGIWTKDLIRNCGLHQSVVSKILKSLTNSDIIKTVKSVKNPTRKIYMLASLAPSVELTGGAWFSDNELDSEFIRILSMSCLQFIKTRCQPKLSAGQKNSLSADDRRQLGISHVLKLKSEASLPTSDDLLLFIQNSGVTQQELTREEMDQLLEILLYDGLIRSVPMIKNGKMRKGYLPESFSSMPIEEPALTGFTEAPCGRCQLMPECASLERNPSKGISPASCLYYSKIIDEFI